MSVDTLDLWEYFGVSRCLFVYHAFYTCVLILIFPSLVMCSMNIIYNCDNIKNIELVVKLKKLKSWNPKTIILFSLNLPLLYIFLKKD